MITPDNVVAHEIIGLHAKVAESTNPAVVGLEGTIVFETRNTFSIRTGGATKQIAKMAAKKIELVTQSGACFISGSSMIARPEDRTSRL